MILTEKERSFIESKRFFREIEGNKKRNVNYTLLTVKKTCPSRKFRSELLLQATDIFLQFTSGRGFFLASADKR